MYSGFDVEENILSGGGKYVVVHIFSVCVNCTCQNKQELHCSRFRIFYVLLLLFPYTVFQKPWLSSYLQTSYLVLNHSIYWPVHQLIPFSLTYTKLCYANYLPGALVKRTNRIRTLYGFEWAGWQLLCMFIIIYYKLKIIWLQVNILACFHKTYIVSG